MQEQEAPRSRKPSRGGLATALARGVLTTLRHLLKHPAGARAAAVAPPSGRQRIIIVANRLPVTVAPKDDGFDLLPSTGGLATGLRSLRLPVDPLWVGWPGLVEEGLRPAVDQRLRRDLGCVPVFLDPVVAERFYEGYANGTLWPLLHSMPSLASFAQEHWEAYQEANAKIATATVAVCRPGDVIWVHDYHLFLLGRMLREALPRATVGFFLHIPFPSYEIFRQLPQHQEILDALLQYDLIGFHTHDYSQAFLECVRRVKGLDNALGRLVVGDRVVQVDVFPMGIDFDRFASALDRVPAQEELRQYRASFGDRRVVFSVARLDYTKGIPEALASIREFLQRRPDWHERVTFVLVIVPSREGVPRYAALKREIDEGVGAINGRFGSVDWVPIRYIYRALSFDELTALYASASVALITPLRDGMNLVAMEYLAVHTDCRAALVLSAFAGVAKELQEAIIVNPMNVGETADAIGRALELEPGPLQERVGVMRDRLRAHDICQWVTRFFDRLRQVDAASSAMAVRMLTPAAERDILRAYERADRRLVILDYDGTLVPFAGTPDAAAPDSELLALLAALAADEANHLVILSGRDRMSLQRWLGDLPAELVAEHGGWMRRLGATEWTRAISSSDVSWKEEIRPVLDLAVGRIPGSFVEEKDYSLVWHYRTAEEESAARAGRELMNTLVHLAANLNIQVLPGDHSVEARITGMSKGAYFTNVLAPEAPEFILAVGDDWTDEDLFAALPRGAFTIKAAPKLSRAQWNLESHREVRALLQRCLRTAARTQAQ